MIRFVFKLNDGNCLNINEEKIEYECEYKSNNKNVSTLRALRLYHVERNCNKMLPFRYLVLFCLFRVLRIQHQKRPFTYVWVLLLLHTFKY